MRRASSKLISHLQHQNPRASYSLLSRIASNHIDQSQTLLNPTKKIQSLLLPTPKILNFSRNFNALVDDSPVSPSRHTNLQEKLDLDEASESAQTVDEMLKAFEDMEASLEEKELGLAALKLGLKLDQEGEDPQRTLDFGIRALNVLDKGDKPSLFLAMNLRLLGSVCYSLKRFDESLGYLDRANGVLGELEKDNSCSPEEAMPILDAIQLELFNVKTALGRRGEATAHLRRSLEIKEMTLDENSKEIGKACRELAEAYVAIINFKEALSFCLKAIEIHEGLLGSNSVEVAHDRRLLGTIYTGLEEHEKAFEQNQLSQSVLRSWGLATDVLRAEIDAANMQISLGRYEEAIKTLKTVMQQTDKESEDRARIFVALARALTDQEKFVDAKKCLEISFTIYHNLEMKSPVAVSEAYMEISLQYLVMNEFEDAISILKRALPLIEKISSEQHSVGFFTARIGWILMFTGKVEQAIPYLEDGTEKLKESLGSAHSAIGYVYNYLGEAYMELDRPQSAAQVYAYAYNIMEVSVGPNHADTIDAMENLSKAHAAMGRHGSATNSQEKATEAGEGHGRSEEAQQIAGEIADAIAEHLSKAMAISSEESDDDFESSIPEIEKAKDQF